MAIEALGFKDFDGPSLDWLDLEEKVISWELDLDCEEEEAAVVAL
jgi:hypothetical protein